MLSFIRSTFEDNFLLGSEDIQVEKLSSALEISKFKEVSLTNRKLAEKYPEIEKSLSKGKKTKILLYEQEDQENINELMEKSRG